MAGRFRYGDGHSSRDLACRHFVWQAADAPMILVNPWCEAAFLHKEGFWRGRWRISSLDLFLDGGFRRGAAPKSPPPPVRGLGIDLDVDRVSVTASTGALAGLSWNAAISGDVYAKARAQGLFLVGVTSVLDPPNAQITDEHLRALFKTPCD